MSSLKIIVTGDGSHSILNETLNETYHSVHGAVQESLHVFIKNGLAFLLNRSSQKHIEILEVGFGTGLNAWLTTTYCKPFSVTVAYTSLEPFPLASGVWSELNYAKEEDEKILFQKLHHIPWASVQTILPNFNLLKIETSLQKATLPTDSYDLVFYDAFAPNKQPEMWEYSLLEKVFSLLKSGGILVTYCAKGQFKRDLKSLGMDVEVLAGPPGKKEMVRATKK